MRHVGRREGIDIRGLVKRVGREGGYTTTTATVAMSLVVEGQGRDPVGGGSCDEQVVVGVALVGDE